MMTRPPPGSATEFVAAQARWDRVFYGYLPYVGIGFLLAISIPDEGATSPLIRSLVESVAAVVPSLNKLAVLSPFPEMTRTFGALMWLIYPVFSIWGLLRAPRVPHRRMTWPVLIFTVPVGVACMVVFGVLAPFFFTDVSADRLGYLHGRGVAGLTFIMTSRIGHGTLGSLLFACSSFSIVFVCRVARDYPGLIAHKFGSGYRRASLDSHRLGD